MTSSPYPRGLPTRYQWHWDNAWTSRARLHPGFRKWLGANGYLSPHFTRAEAASKDGKPVPDRLLSGAHRHAFNLERLRHELGDKPVPIVSWYRSPERNRAADGAAGSKHLEALATDHPVEWVRQHKNFDAIADKIFADDGFGQYPNGNRHVDSRGSRARWSTWTPGR